MLRRLLGVLCMLSVLVLATSGAHAALNPVFFFDASVYNTTDDIPADSTIEDQSTANHDGIVRFDAVHISTDVPAGLTGKSFDLTGIGMFETVEGQLLLNENVVTAGGFIMEAWFKHDLTSGSGTGKVIDYGGFERIQFAGSNSGAGALNNKTQFEFRMSNTTHRVGGRQPIELDNQWHYALAEFIVTDGSDLTNVRGQMRITIDGQSDVKVDGGKTNAGDNAINTFTGDFASKLAIGTRSTVNPANPGGSGDNLEGLVYQPKVWLGTIADPVRLVVNTTTGNISFGYTQNATIPGATRFGTRINSYEITSAAGSLRPENLNSFEQQNLDPNPGTGEDGRFDADDDADGADFLEWQRTVTESGALAHTGANATADARINAIDLAIWSSKFGSPTHWQTLTSSANSLSEFHGTHGSVVGGPAPLALGAAFNPAKPQDLVFKYTIDGDPVVHNGIIQYVAAATPTPEPSSFALAAISLAAMRRRRKLHSSPPRRNQ
jgi:hypothetical protein